MLTFLKVTGFAIIDELQVEFEDGFNVITGETGAGKSIIINALSTLINAKTSSEMVRSSANHAEVTGHFFKGEGEYILKRVINLSGRSRALLNENPVTLARLEELGEMLINIYGQNEFQHLLDRTHYISMLDRLLLLEGERKDLSEKVRELKSVSGLLEARKGEIGGRDKEVALLEFQVDEIGKADLREGEEAEIRERLKVLKDAEKIHATLSSVAEGIYEGDGAVQETLKRFASMLRPFGSIEAMENLRIKLESLSFAVEDVLLELKSIEKTLHDDPDELARLEERLSRLYTLKDKYGKTYEDIGDYAEKAGKRLEYLKALSDDISDLEKKKASLETLVRQKAEKLSSGRKEGLRRIEKAVADELAHLSMKGMQFKIEMTDRDVIEEDGKEDVELLISTNPGEDLKPLRKVASGGELSRIMLAIKRIMGGEEERTLIFDEIDSGIGGKVAEMVGRRLKDLSKKNQVICITHLPQIAVYGDHHFLVEKIQEKKSTTTKIKKLFADERTQEVARMLGGIAITEKTILRAEEMLKHDQESRN